MARISRDQVIARFREGALVGDGAMGSLLYERGIYINRCFDSLCLSQPETVLGVHRDYVNAGAEVLQTNTYGANAIKLEYHGLAEITTSINERAVALALEAAGPDTMVAGTIGPTGLSPTEAEARADAILEAYASQAKALDRAGADLVLIETIADPTEIQLATEAVRKVSDLPLVTNIKAGPDGAVVGNLPLKELLSRLEALGADAVGANCQGPAAVLEAVARMLEATSLPVFAYPNAGQPESIEDRLIYMATPENFGVFARRLFKLGASAVGGCCGTNPSHVRRVSSAARMVRPRRAPAQIDCENPRLPLQERSDFGRRLAEGRFVISAEVNPAKGLDCSKQVAAVDMLVEAGVDAINVADGPRASVRMSNLAFATKFRDRTNVLLHVCCRDRNLLALQAHVLGAHAQGVRDLVVITGDPPKLGDYPDATAVFDLDSIGLLGLVDGFNRGIDYAGKCTKARTKFVLATGVEPAATDMGRELDRLHQKVEAGADLIMTQPIFDTVLLDEFLGSVRDIGVPIMLGLLPLASHRNAEFLHKHVPGISVPESLRTSMLRAPSPEAALELGKRHALEMLEHAGDRVQGAYIMPPLGKYAITAEMVREIRGARG